MTQSFTRFTYDLLKNIERKETFLKRFHIAEIMTEVPQSTFSILYNKQNLISELRDEKNGVCYTYLYDAHNKLIKIIGCKENSAFDGVYNFVYTFYK